MPRTCRRCLLPARRPRTRPQSSDRHRRAGSGCRGLRVRPAHRPTVYVRGVER
jgi:hypothetical protein